MPKKSSLFDLKRLRSFFELITDETVTREERQRRRREVVESFKARSDANRSFIEVLVDELVTIFGSIPFFLFHILLFVGWLTLNLDLVPGLETFDPFPFSLLTTIVSLEAIFLSIFVLMSQNRSAKVADLREEVDLNINLLTEEEVTKLLNMVDDIHRHLKLKRGRDQKLEQLKKKTDVRKLQTDIEQSVEDAKKRD